MTLEDMIDKLLWMKLKMFRKRKQSFSHGTDQESKSHQNTPNTLNDIDRLQVVSNYTSQRRESYLYRLDSDSDNPAPPRSSRHSSVSSEGIHADELVTPFAQILSTLQTVRSNFVLLTNTRQNRFRRGSEGFHLNTRLCQLYEISEGNMIRDDMFKKLTLETLKEFDWCLDQLDTLKASMSVSEMASNKFKRMLDKELKDCTETGVGGPEISAWVFNTFVDKKIDAPPAKDTKTLRARSKSLVKSFKKLSTKVNCSTSVPRFGVACLDEDSLEAIMENIHNWEFDVFKLAELTKNSPLPAVFYTIFQARELLNTFKIKPHILVNYMNIVESHYLREVPFHNSTHAADVVQATNILLSSSAFEGVFDDLEILAALFAAAIHDVDHPGVNNQFLINSSSEMALMYNDSSVLENHHLAVGFQLLQSDGCDMLENLTKEERIRFRKMVIELVLATDNEKHMNILGSLKTLIETKKLSDGGGSKHVQITTCSEKMNVLKCLVHCADISNPTRPQHLYEVWVDRLMQEFFRQGDIERDGGMQISPMMDRHNANIEKSQVVFIDYVVHPLWETWNDLVYPDAQYIVDQLVSNREYYRGLCPGSPAATPTSTPKVQRKKSSPQEKTEKTKSSKKLRKKSSDDNDNNNNNTKKDRASEDVKQNDTSFLVKNDIKLFQNKDIKSIPNFHITINNNNNNNSNNGNTNTYSNDDANIRNNFNIKQGTNNTIANIKRLEYRRRSDTDVDNNQSNRKDLQDKHLRNSKIVDSSKDNRTRSSGDILELGKYKSKLRLEDNIDNTSNKERNSVTTID